MVDELINEYEETFNEEITLPIFFELSEDEQIKILQECLDKKQKIYENDHFNNNYIEEVE